MGALLWLVGCAVEQELVPDPTTPSAPSAEPEPEPAAIDSGTAPPRDTAVPEPIVRLMVSELMIDPAAVDDAHGEWIELWSTSTESVDLTGLTLSDDGVDAAALGVLAIAPDERVVLCADGDPALNGGVACAATWTWKGFGGGLALANTGDELEVALRGAVLDRVSWDRDFAEPGAATGRDASGLWCPQEALLEGGDRGTPGAPNRECP